MCFFAKLNMSPKGTNNFNLLVFNADKITKNSAQY